MNCNFKLLWVSPPLSSLHTGRWSERNRTNNYYSQLMKWIIFLTEFSCGLSRYSCQHRTMWVGNLSTVSSESQSRSSLASFSCDSFNEAVKVFLSYKWQRNVLELYKLIIAYCNGADVVNISSFPDIYCLYSNSSNATLIILWRFSVWLVSPFSTLDYS